MKSYFPLLCTLFIFVLLVACGNDAEKLDKNEALIWQTCPSGYIGQCALTTVPLDWKKSDGKTIDILVSRLRATGTVKGQLWLQNGGIGDSAIGFSAQLENHFADIRKNYDIYIMEHRGVGGSTRLTCPKGEATTSEKGVSISENELTSCMEYLFATWGEGLKQFSVSNAARDLAYLIEKTKITAPMASFVYGFSYGSYVVQRLHQIAPYVADGLLLDGIVVPDLALFEDSFNDDDTFIKLAKLCDQDDFCRQKTAGNTWQMITDTVSLMAETQHCPKAYLPPEALKSMTKFLVGSWLKDLLIPYYYRLNRCNEADVTVLNNFTKTLLENVPANIESPQRSSNLLSYNIKFSELTKIPGPSADTIIEHCRQRIACSREDYLDVFLRDNWPRYQRDEFYGSWPNFQVPVLALNGGLDAYTDVQIARQIVGQLHNNDQYYIEFPLVGHGVVAPFKYTGLSTCAVSIVKSFLDDPSSKPNTDCIRQAEDFDFNVQTEESEALFGQDDIWEN